MAIAAHLGYSEGKEHASLNMFIIGPWVAESEVLMMDEIPPLAHRLGNVCLLALELTSGFIEAMGRVLRAHIHSLGLHRFEKPDIAADWELLWVALLAALPRL